MSQITPQSTTQSSAQITTESQVNFELDLLEKALRYQEWLFDLVSPFLGKRILEVGSGIGNLSQWLPKRELLVLSELDAALFERLERKMKGLVNASKAPSNAPFQLLKHDLMQDSLIPLKDFSLDTIVSFNVLEHIRDDSYALRRMAEILNIGMQPLVTKRIVSVVPAHQWAYGPVDAGYEHFRRYTASFFGKQADQFPVKPKVYFKYFNRMGLLGWFVNGRILKRKKIGQSSIDLYEKLCPWFRLIDEKLFDPLHLPFGQSLLCVYEWSGTPDSILSVK